MMITRFAPSPTGYLHIGNARTALWNFLITRKAGGSFILRLDDTDVERSRPEYADAIVEDLAWLGVTHDRLVRQTDRLDHYALALEALKAKGLLYPAYETPEELDRKRKRQQARGLPPIYDRTALKLTEAERAELEEQGRRPHWRFRLSGETVRWQDAVRGEAHIETASLSDPVLARADGTVLYTFASVVDDAEMGITHVIRGEDHVANTAVQIEIFKALGAALPTFAHHNLIAAADGTEMSKRTGSLSLRSFRDKDADPMAVASVAVLTGTSEPLHVVDSLEKLGELVDFGKLSRALTRFDPAEIAQLSTKLLHTKPFSAVAAELEAYGIQGAVAEAFWIAVRGNLSVLSDVAAWWAVVAADITPVVEDAAFLDEAADLLPPLPWTGDVWHAWVNAVKEKTGRKGKPLFMPLRQALTGQDHGPEMQALLPLIGYDHALKRLRGTRP